jgi:hypothetical protein
VPPEATSAAGPPSSAAIALGATTAAATAPAAPAAAPAAAALALAAEAAALEAAAVAGGMNPLAEPSDELGMFSDEPDSLAVTTQPGAAAALPPAAAFVAHATAPAAAAISVVAAGGAKDFASFLFASPADPSAALAAAAAVAPSKSAAPTLFAAAKTPGAKSKGWGMVKAAHAQSLAAHHEKSTAQLQSEQAKLLAFLESCGLGAKYSAFHELGVDSVADAVDEGLVDVAALTNEIGLSPGELAVFQDKAKAARTMGKLGATF